MPANSLRVIHDLTEWHQLRQSLTGTVGLVPTMGFLHEGHLSLVRAARQQTDIVVVWIFVNPTQFGDPADFAAYPQNMAQDLALLQAEGVDYVLAPTPEAVYPPGFQTEVQVRQVSAPLEGAFRPGHFTGVATVVAKLFNLVWPHKAYFGQKDAQQVVVLRQMVKDLNYPLEMVVCPTMREADGLAMSSRNVRLSSVERTAAPVLYQALQLAQQQLTAGQRQAASIKTQMRALIEAELQTAQTLGVTGKVEYVSLAHPQTLEELETVEGSALISLAVHLGQVRLIDNLLIEA